MPFATPDTPTCLFARAHVMAAIVKHTLTPTWVARISPSNQMGSNSWDQTPNNSRAEDWHNPGRHAGQIAGIVRCELGSFDSVQLGRADPDVDPRRRPG